MDKAKEEEEIYLQITQIDYKLVLGIVRPPYIIIMIIMSF